MGLVNSAGVTQQKHSIAQSFGVNEASGIYVTAVELFFASRDTSFPVHIQIRPLINGHPSEYDYIPGTQKIIAGSAINVSSDATSGTRFEFDEPAYLLGSKDYAIVISADSLDYKIFLAETDAFLIGSTEKRITRQPQLGNMFYSNNGTTYDPNMNQDLTFKLYRAKFQNLTATAVLTNADVPRVRLQRNPIITTNSSGVVRVVHPNHGLQVGEVVAIEGADSAGVGGILGANLNGNRTITHIDWTGFKFTAGGSDTADSSVRSGGSGIIAGKNIPYHILHPNIEMLMPQNTRALFTGKSTTGKSYAGAETAFQLASNYSGINNHEDNITQFPQLVVHDSSEATNMSNAKSLQMQVVMSARDSAVAPMIDMQRTSATTVGFIIDKQDSAATTGFNVPLDYVTETASGNGSMPNRHITKTTVLEEDAVGLKILIDANRPNSTDFQVYYRTCSGEQVLSEQAWVLVTEETNNSIDEEASIFKEYRYIAGGPGGDLPSFTQFQIKIVFRSTNSAKTAVIRNIRMIALSV